MTDDPRLAETGAIAAELERAGLVTVTKREDAQPVFTFTPEGEQVARQMALSSEDDAAVLLDALLDAPLEGRSTP